MPGFSFLNRQDLILLRLRATPPLSRAAADDDLDFATNSSTFLRAVVAKLKEEKWTIRVGKTEKDAVNHAAKLITVRLRAKVMNVGGYKKEVFSPHETTGMLSSLVFQALRQDEIAAVAAPAKEEKHEAYVARAVEALAAADAGYAVSVLVVRIQVYTTGAESMLYAAGRGVDVGNPLVVPIHEIPGFTSIAILRQQEIVKQHYERGDLPGALTMIAKVLARQNKARYEAAAAASWKRAHPEAKPQAAPPTGRRPAA